MTANTNHGPSGKEQKVARALELIENSGGMKQFPLELTLEQWAGVFAEMQEEKVDDLLLILEEEAKMKLSDEQTEKRAHKVNQTRYLQRMERLKLSLEQAQQNASEDDNSEK